MKAEHESDEPDVAWTEQQVLFRHFCPFPPIILFAT